MKKPVFAVGWIDTLNEGVGKVASWIILILVAECAVDLLMRKIIGHGLFFAFDMNYMFYGTQFMLAGAYTIKWNAHVRVDVIYNRFSPRGRAILETIYLVCLLLPMAIFMTYGCWNHYVSSVAAREIGIVSAWHPPIYFYKTVMPITFALVVLQGVAILVKSITTIITRKPALPWLAPKGVEI